MANGAGWYASGCGRCGGERVEQQADVIPIAITAKQTLRQTGRLTVPSAWGTVGASLTASPMSRFYTVLAAGLFGLAPPALAQTGFVVTADGDTLRGEVLPAVDLTASRGAQLRTPSGEVRAFTPETAREVVDGAGRRYLGRAVAAEYGGTAEPFFLQVLVDGQLSLYKLAFAAQDDHFFVAAGGAAPEGLYVTRDRVAATDVPEALSRRAPATEAVRERYRTTLARAFFGCPDLQAETVRIGLTQPDLTRAVAAFNACVGAPAAVAGEAATQRRGDLAVAVTPRLGGGVASLGLSGEQSTPQTALPYGGALVEAALLSLPGRTSLAVEGALQRKAVLPDGFLLQGGRTAGDAVFGTSYLTLSYGARYAHTALRVAPYVGAGFVNSVVLDAPAPFSPAPSIRVEPPTYEAGIYGEVGVEVPVAGGPLVIGLRAERTAIGQASPLAVWTGSAQTVSGADTQRNQTFTVVVGRRFGR